MKAICAEAALIPRWATSNKMGILSVRWRNVAADSFFEEVTALHAKPVAADACGNGAADSDSIRLR